MYLTTTEAEQSAVVINGHKYVPLHVVRMRLLPRARKEGAGIQLSTGVGRPAVRAKKKTGGKKGC